jgi:hypothetical protein
MEPPLQTKIQTAMLGKMCTYKKKLMSRMEGEPEKICNGSIAWRARIEVNLPV